MVTRVIARRGSKFRRGQLVLYSSVLDEGDAREDAAGTAYFWTWFAGVEGRSLMISSLTACMDILF